MTIREKCFALFAGKGFIREKCFALLAGKGLSLRFAREIGI